MVISDVRDGKFYRLPPEKENTACVIDRYIASVCLRSEQQLK